jgi:hypothetical protein
MPAVDLAGGRDDDAAMHHSLRPVSARARLLILCAYALALSPGCFMVLIWLYSIAAGHDRWFMTMVGDWRGGG